ncbi:hypothetical protein HDU92_002106 [Lobulomyces angularis]|nr:hypothetical protein HDU92_002106 [Lobulomyces angularis]
MNNNFSEFSNNILDEAKSVSNLENDTEFNEPSREISNGLNFSLNFSHKNKFGPLNINLWLNKTMFVAGNDLSGRFEINCKSSHNVKIGDILVKVTGYEESLTDEKNQASKKNIFFERELYLQSIDLPPSDAVIAGRPDEHGMWVAVKQSTVFNFKVPLKSKTCNLPSSFWSDYTGGVRYIVTGLVHAKINNKLVKLPLSINREAFVVEKCNFSLQKSFEAEEITTSFPVSKWKPFNSKKGTFTVDASIFGPIWSAGGIGFIGLQMKNESPKKIKTLTVSLYRRLKIFKLDSSGEQIPKSYKFSRILVNQTKFLNSKNSEDFSKIQTGGWWSEKNFNKINSKNSIVKNFWDGVKVGEERFLLVDVNIPIHCRNISGGKIFDGSFIVNILLEPENPSKSEKKLELEIPIKIYHPASLIESLPKLLIEKKLLPKKKNCDGLDEQVSEVMQEIGNLALAAENPTIVRDETNLECNLTEKMPDSPKSLTTTELRPKSPNEFEVNINRFSLDLPPPTRPPFRTPNIDYGSFAKMNYGSQLEKRLIIPSFESNSFKPNKSSYIEQDDLSETIFNGNVNEKRAGKIFSREDKTIVKKHNNCNNTYASSVYSNQNFTLNLKNDENIYEEIRNLNLKKRNSIPNNFNFKTYSKKINDENFKKDSALGNDFNSLGDSSFKVDATIVKKNTKLHRDFSKNSLNLRSEMEESFNSYKPKDFCSPKRNSLVNIDKLIKDAETFQDDNLKSNKEFDSDSMFECCDEMLANM